MKHKIETFLSNRELCQPSPKLISQDLLMHATSLFIELVIEERSGEDGFMIIQNVMHNLGYILGFNQDGTNLNTIIILGTS